MNACYAHSHYRACYHFNPLTSSSSTTTTQHNPSTIALSPPHHHHHKILIPTLLHYSILPLRQFTITSTSNLHRLPHRSSSTILSFFAFSTTTRQVPIHKKLECAFWRESSAWLGYLGTFDSSIDVDVDEWLCGVLREVSWKIKKLSERGGCVSISLRLEMKERRSMEDKSVDLVVRRRWVNAVLQKLVEWNCFIALSTSW